MDPVTATLGAAAISGGAGLVGDIIGAYGASKDRKAAERRRKQANRQIGSWESQAQAILNEAMNNNVSLSSEGDLAAYQNLKRSYDPSKYIYDFDPFDKSDYHVEDYLNPQREAILSDVAKRVQHTAAGAGLGHSSGAVEAIAEGIINKDEELYNQAREQMNTERSFDYGAYTDFINQKQKQLDTLQSGALQRMGMLRGDIQFDQEQQDALLANRLNLGNAVMQARAQLV